VQIDPLGAAGGSADWDSGTVASPLSGVDLATTAYPGFSTAGGTTQWRVRPQDGSGLWADWSDWATWTYRARPTLTINSPTGGVIQDVTPPLQATVGSGTITGWRITVVDSTDQSSLLYDTGKRGGSGTSFTHTPPLKDPVSKKQIFLVGKTYRIDFYVWDAYAREGWAQSATATVTMSDGAPTAPVLSSVTTAHEYPQMTLVWTRATAPDAWLISLDGQPYKRLDLADTSVVGTTYTYADPDVVSPNTSHSWTVRAIVNNIQGPASNTVQTTTALDGVWLISSVGGVCIRGTQGMGGWRRNDRAAVYRPTWSPVPVVVYDAQEGLAGDFEGPLLDEPGLTVEQALDRLDAMKADPTTPVWLVADRAATPVWLLNLTAGPDPDADGEIQSRVSFSYVQATDPAYGD
jgi:hypothetical protein